MYLSVWRQLSCEYTPTNKKKQPKVYKVVRVVYKQLRIDLVLL